MEAVLCPLSQEGDYWEQIILLPADAPALTGAAGDRRLDALERIGPVSVDTLPVLRRSGMSVRVLGSRTAVEHTRARLVQLLPHGTVLVPATVGITRIEQARWYTADLAHEAARDEAARGVRSLTGTSRSGPTARGRSRSPVRAPQGGWVTAAFRVGNVPDAHRITGAVRQGRLRGSDLAYLGAMFPNDTMAIWTPDPVVFLSAADALHAQLTEAEFRV